MNKKNILSALAVLVVISGFNVCYAEDNTQQQPLVKDEKPFNSEAMPPRHHKDMPGRIDEQKHPMHNPEMRKHKSNRMEIEKRLNLTEEQKQQREIQKQKDIEEIKPILDNIRTKRQEFRAVQEDTNLSQAEKNQKMKKIKSELKELKMKADEKRKEDLKNFESLLTTEQKKEFAKIKEEQEQRKKDFDKIKKTEDKLKLPPMGPNFPPENK